MDLTKAVETAGRAAAWLCIAGLILFSVVPGQDRPHTGLPGVIEHLLAYAATGFLFAIGYHDPTRRAVAVLLAIVISACLEVVQMFIPNRDPKAIDWIASSAGFTVGILLATALVWTFLRVPQRSVLDRSIK